MRLAAGFPVEHSFVAWTGDAWLHDPRPAMLGVVTTALDAHTAQTLLVMARQLFPHEPPGDQYSATVVEAVDQAGGERRGARKLLTDGVARSMVRAHCVGPAQHGARNAVPNGRPASLLHHAHATINNL